jgi:hypothetical protein
MGWFSDDTEIKAALDKAVHESARPATRLTVGPASDSPEAFGPTGMRFGGEPYAERGEAWPTWGPARVPYDFALQLDLRDCEGRPDIPIELIAVFVCWAAVDEVDVENACIVRGYGQPTPSRAVSMERPPPKTPSDYRVVPCSIATEPARTYPWNPDSVPEIQRAAARFKRPDRAYKDALQRASARDSHFSRIGGHPAWVHDATLEGDDYVFVAQVEYDVRTGLLIGDAAPIYIAWARSKARFLTDCFQSY